MKSLIKRPFRPRQSNDDKSYGSTADDNALPGTAARTSRRASKREKDWRKVQQNTDKPLPLEPQKRQHTSSSHSQRPFTSNTALVPYSPRRQSFSSWPISRDVIKAHLHPSKQDARPRRSYEETTRKRVDHPKATTHNQSYRSTQVSQVLQSAESHEYTRSLRATHTPEHQMVQTASSCHQQPYTEAHQQYREADSENKRMPERDGENSKLQRTVVELEQAVAQFGRESAEKTSELAEKTAKLAEQAQWIEKLREKLIDAANRPVPAAGVRMTLKLPESIIMRDFQSVAYELRNFVKNCVKDPDSTAILNWANTWKDQLHRVGIADPRKYAKHQVYSHHMIEACLWEILMDMVFFNCSSFAGPAARWAGDHGPKMSKLGQMMFELLNPKDESQLEAFGQWRAQTANLCHTLAKDKSLSTEAAILNAMATQLTPLRPRLTPDQQNHLRSLLCKAISLDESLRGQQVWYELRYPAGGAGLPFDPETMHAVVTTSSNKVAFFVRPYLCCKRLVDEQGISKRKWEILEPCSVAMTQSRFG